MSIFLNQFTIIIFLFAASESLCHSSTPPKFPIKESTIDDLQLAFKHNKLTSVELVEFYLNQIKKLNPSLRAVIEVNPDALEQARTADYERTLRHGLPMLHGIPVLLKDNIATKDKLNTTCGSLALLGSVVAKDSGVVNRLRLAGAVILGKASLSEWAHFRSFSAPSGWCARTGQGKNPYNVSKDPCGSSSGSAIAAATNMATVTLGTETDGSIICPSDHNSVVGIKPTVGLTSRAGVIPVSPRQDTVGPICRTVRDAVYLLDAIVGFDADDEATKTATKYIPRDGYAQFLKAGGLHGKRLGIISNSFDFAEGSVQDLTYKRHMLTLRENGAILVGDLKIKNLDKMSSSETEVIALVAEFKVAINSYLNKLVKSPVRSLTDVIQFNNRFAKKEKVKEYGQDILVQAEETKGIGEKEKEKEAISMLKKLSREGFEKVMKDNELDAIVSPGYSLGGVLAIGGYPGITVPAGYDNNGMPFGLCFGGVRGSDHILIQIAYAFEQATKIRKTPSLLGCGDTGMSDVARQ